jgi:NADPH:quinone reductase-like Zn-dependent oxidoreductase
MKAIVVHKYGGPEVLKFEECSDPVPGQGDVLVRAAAASANPIDAERGGLRQREKRVAAGRSRCCLEILLDSI